MRDPARTIRARMAPVPIVVALGVSACGSAGSPAASRSSPPDPIVVSVDVSATQIRVSPTRLGAGPVLLTVTNHSARAIALRVAGGAHGVARTPPIDPQGITQLKLGLGRGDYALTAAPAGRRSDAQRTLPSRIAAARLRVGRERASGSDQLLSP